VRGIPASGGGPPQSKTLARWPVMLVLREASWSAPVLWRFGTGTDYVLGREPGTLPGRGSACRANFQLSRRDDGVRGIAGQIKVIKRQYR